MRYAAFVVPGDLNSLTGGYGYDREILAGLGAAGWSIDVVRLDASYPWPSLGAKRDAARKIAAIADGTVVVVDGLAFGAMPELALQHAARLRWMALVHHPLALESGLDQHQARQLFDSERSALAAAKLIVTTSAATARALKGYGVTDERIRIVLPGTMRAAPASTSADKAVDTSVDACAAASLLCVATLTPRKGHALLFEALAALQDRAWMLHCVGSTALDPDTTAALRADLADRGLAARVHLHGELPALALQDFYARTDVFVLASYHEGYGMALTEALAHGLPIVSTTAGAIPDTVPAAAGVLVRPGDVTALRAALAKVLDDPAHRGLLAAGARAARNCLPRWSDAVAQFEAALHALRSPYSLRRR